MTGFVELGSAPPAGVPARNVGGNDIALSPQRLRLRRAAQELESLFLHHLLKSMRAASEQPESSEDADSGAPMMHDFMDEQLARGLARGGGIGLARLLEREYAIAVERDAAKQPAQLGAPSLPAPVQAAPPRFQAPPESHQAE